MGRKAFSGDGKFTNLIVKSKLLKSKNVKKCLTGSSVKTVKVNLGSKKLNKKYVKTYKTVFAKKNSGKKVTVQ